MRCAIVLLKYKYISIMYLWGVLHTVLVLCAAVLATIDIRRGGWLDRLVQYQKEKFINDVNEVSPVKINATIIPKPPGYTDSKDWNFDSVTHLMMLIRESGTAAPVHRALRRMMRPNRRLMMSMGESFKHFPSLSKQSMNEFYYDVGSAEDYSDEMPREVERGVIMVTNPVEARLPSAQISIKLLKEILMQRAIAARQMPSTTASTIPWVPMNKTKGGGGGGGGGGDGGGEGKGGGDGGATDAGGGGGKPEGTEAGPPAGEGGDAKKPEGEAEGKAEGEAEGEAEGKAEGEPEKEPEAEA